MNGPYILIIPPPGYPGKRYRGRYAYEHRVNFWKKYKKIPKNGEVIHHKNHDRTDNRIVNLELTSRKKHSGHHKRKIAYVDMICAHCNCVFVLRKRNYDSKKKYQNRFFCCRSHQVSTQQKERWIAVRETK